MNPKWDEQILVVKRVEIFNEEKNVFQGVLVRDSDENIAKGQEIVEALNGFKIMRRGDKHDPTPMENNAEINHEFKQPIPYAVIRKGSELFVYKRLEGGGESRLHGKLSLGAGGHMNDFPDEEKELIGDYDFFSLLTNNLERELSEELFISAGERQNDIIGFINDDENDVGRVHLGILVIIDISENTEVEVQEKEQLEGSWMTIEQLLEPETYERLEPWSKIVIDALK